MNADARKVASLSSAGFDPAVLVHERTRVFEHGICSVVNCESPSEGARRGRYFVIGQKTLLCRKTAAISSIGYPLFAQSLRELPFCSG